MKSFYKYGLILFCFVVVGCASHVFGESVSDLHRHIFYSVSNVHLDDSYLN